MYDQSKLSELIRFARVHAVSAVIDVYPGDGDWTRLFSDLVGPEGPVYSFVPAEVAHFKNDQAGRMRALAKEPGRGKSKPSQLAGGADPRRRNKNGTTARQLASLTTSRGGVGSPEAKAQQEKIVRLLDGHPKPA